MVGFLFITPCWYTHAHILPYNPYWNAVVATINRITHTVVALPILPYSPYQRTGSEKINSLFSHKPDKVCYSGAKKPTNTTQTKMANKIDYSNELYRLETSLHHILDKAQELVANFMLENNLATVNFNTDLDGNSPDHPDFDEEQYERHRVFCYAHHFGEPNKEMPLMNITLHVTENKWQETMMNDSEWKPSNYSFTFIAGEGEKKYFNVVDDVALYLEILDWLMSRY